MQKPRWENEEWTLEHPDEAKIACKDCYHREPDRTLYSGKVIKGSTLGMCAAYSDKPDDILFNGEECPYYLCEDE